MRFTPPRELTPPPLRQTDTVQSYQTLTLGGGTSQPNDDVRYQQQQQNGYTDSYGADPSAAGAADYGSTVTAPVMKSAAKISLRQA